MPANDGLYEVFDKRFKSLMIGIAHLDKLADGCIWAAKTGAPRGRIYFATTSAGLASDVACLLSRLGIVARVRTIQQRGYKPSHPVDVSGADNMRRFLDVVGVYGPRFAQAERLRPVLESMRANTNVDTLPVEVFERVKSLMAEQGITQRAMAAARGTRYGGASHFSFAPSREVVASYAEILDDDVLRSRTQDDLFWDRVVSIEDTTELQCSVPNHVDLLAVGSVSMLDCLRACMRLKPTRIVVGEVRGAEAHTMLKAWNTGHPGGAATVHANDALSGLIRLESLVAEATSAPQQTLIAEAVDLVVFVDQEPELKAGRKVREVALVSGYSDGRYQVEFV